MKKKKPYSVLLCDPRWQKLALSIKERDGFQCVRCGEKEKSLVVHHRYYVAGRKPWQYPGFALVTLCWECHKTAHEPPEEGDEPGSEWEQECEFVFGPPSEKACAWDFAVAIAQLAASGVPRKMLWNAVADNLPRMKWAEIMKEVKS